MTDGPVVDELETIEITPEMIRARLDAYFENDRWVPDEVITVILRAALSAVKTR